jgi:hypothetical protein
MKISPAIDLWLLQLHFFKVQLCEKKEKLVYHPHIGLFGVSILFIQLWDGIERPITRENFIHNPF